MSRHASILLLGIGAVLLFMWWRNRGPKLTLLQGGKTGMPDTNAGGGGVVNSYTPITAEVQKLRVANAIARGALMSGQRL